LSPLPSGSFSLLPTPPSFASYRRSNSTRRPSVRLSTSHRPPFSPFPPIARQREGGRASWGLTRWRGSDEGVAGMLRTRECAVKEEKIVRIPDLARTAKLTSFSAPSFSSLLLSCRLASLFVPFLHPFETTGLTDQRRKTDSPTLAIQFARYELPRCPYRRRASGAFPLFSPLYPRHRTDPRLSRSGPSVSLPLPPTSDPVSTFSDSPSPVTSRSR
jgi:hypothetical protein